MTKVVPRNGGRFDTWAIKKELLRTIGTLSPIFSESRSLSPNFSARHHRRTSPQDIIAELLRKTSSLNFSKTSSPNFSPRHHRRTSPQDITAELLQGIIAEHLQDITRHLQEWPQEAENDSMQTTKDQSDQVVAG